MTKMIHYIVDGLTVVFWGKQSVVTINFKNERERDDYLKLFNLCRDHLQKKGLLDG